MVRARSGPEIEAISAREILDCRLEPTLRVRVETAAGAATADVPRGRSRGTHEAVDLRDGGDRYGGMGVREAVDNVNGVIAPELEGCEVTAQRRLDRRLIELDGTARKSELGGNAVVGVSLAVLKAGAASAGVPLYRYVGGAGAHVLPVPFFDLIEGGELAANDLAFQEHQVVPTGAETFSGALRASAEIYHELGEVLAEEWGKESLNTGYEGGYTPPGMSDPRDAFEAELRAVAELGYEREFGLAIDAAATQFYDAETGTYSPMDEEMTTGELIDFYGELVDSYPIRSIEDPLAETDFEGFGRLTEALDVQVIGDDLFVTDTERLRRGIDAGAANALLLKVNQVGTVTEALEAARLATASGYAVQVSERSGQTPDTWLADLAVGLNAGQIKTGVSRGERTEQYNRLLAVESALGGDATYGGGTLEP